ncbi:formate/nitrite transporter family protein [Terrisporobacter mayombei]|uniref:Nitrite transporter NirC n=1 Tax=Terrisporobacter mayombei TaxID=1541 RepID=A0ABY9Q191_9FIRM|nr:formate/nitrite transporter family protein [Terrisporobacter mayombei]MCC3866805.1 formate/nitrite transporter family protein [Terrisporobacter mayombei]WMT81045.1 Nitrite transporter NirC [Terrisporobacter mayombei]
MERLGFTEMIFSAEKKVGFFKSVPLKFFVYSIMAGVFCGLGMILAYSAGGSLNFYESTKGLAKIVFGISFALSFTLIVYAGSELFTGNVGVISIGMYNKSVSAKDGIKLLILVYIGNFIGATLISLLIGAAGLLDNPMTAQYIVSNCAIKMNLPFSQSFFRGILCNMLVVLATWSTSKIKSEPARMLILIWCVYGFCTSGFEHSIANMALFVMGMISPYTTSEISVMGYINNIIPVTLGNIVGGALIIGTVYYFVGNFKKETYGNKKI